MDVEKRNNIKSKTKEFANSILECDEYKEFMKNMEKLNSDVESQNMLNQYQEKQIELRRGEFSPELMDKLQELQTKINKNGIIQSFIKSQEELVNLLKRTNKVITLRIGTSFAFSNGGGCCG